MDSTHLKVVNSILVGAAKGGVVKTGTATSLAAIFAERGARTLCVDIDPQASATRALGIDPAETGEGRALVEALANGEPLRVYPSPGRERLWVVPAGHDTHEASEHLVTPRPETATAEPAPHDAREAIAAGIEKFVKAFADEADRWDVIVIDSPPSVLGSPLGSVALCASQFLVTPCSGNIEDIEGLLGVGEVTAKLSAGIRPLGVALMRISATATRRRAKAVEAVEDILDDFAPLFTTIVRDAPAAVNEAIERGLLPHEYARQGTPGRGGMPANAGALAAEIEQLATEVWEAFSTHTAALRSGAHAA